MSEEVSAPPGPVESPPPADRPVVRDGTDVHARLARLAKRVTATRDRRCLVEFLRLRRASR
jgi:hypothetical protein